MPFGKFDQGSLHHVGKTAHVLAPFSVSFSARSTVKNLLLSRNNFLPRPAISNNAYQLIGARYSQELGYPAEKRCLLSALCAAITLRTHRQTTPLEATPTDRIPADSLGLLQQWRFHSVHTD
jgi:hypothetical protein